MKINLPPQVCGVLKKLNQNGFCAFAVGGCVRDWLLGLTPTDYDVTTDALPQQVCDEVFADFYTIKTGLKHGTVTVIFEGVPIEITTFRIDDTYFDCRHPDSVSFTKDLRQDLSRRDFTVNAMAFHPDCGIVDYFDGLTDLKNGIIKCVGDSTKRFNEDALRILRALRFASILNFKIDTDTANAARQQKQLLNKISAERKAQEFTKLLCGKNAKDVILEYFDILCQIVPQAKPMQGFKQNSVYHIFDVLTHTATTVQNIEATPVLRLAAFFHDIGKPSVYSTDDKGNGHFFGHAAKSLQLAQQFFADLKYDNDTTQKVLTLIKWHDIPIQPSPNSVKRALNKLTPQIFYWLLKLKQADNSAQNPKYDRTEALCQTKQIADQVLAQAECFSLKDLKINGNDLLSLGVSSGKKIGELLNIMLFKVMDNSVKNTKQDLVDYIKVNNLV